MRVALLVLLALAFGADALRTMKNATAVAPHGAKAAATQADVDGLRTKLETVAKGLQAMLSAKDSPIAAGKIGPEMKLFAQELKDTLESTKAIKDPAQAMKKLLDAKASMSGLTSELTARQVALMREEESQQESLLLGVLMTRQKSPLDEQLEILRSSDFKNLQVSKALLAKHDDKAPLYAQVAEFLDAHKGKGTAQAAVSKAQDRAKAQDKVKDLVASFQQRVVSLKKAQDEKKAAHLKRVKALKDGIEKASKTEKHVMQIMLKREERNYKKWAAVQEHDISSMEAAVTAIKNHDVKGLEKARQALSDSIKNLQSKNAGFLVLAQLGHQLTERDCPYCAAQCVDKCHQAGKSFTQCLGDCADAGKR